MNSYHQHPAYSSSDLKAFRDGPPAMLPWRRANPIEQTPAMRLGAAAHCLILEGAEAFEERYVVKPEGMSFATKDGKAWRDEHVGFEILTHAEGEALARIASVANTHPLIRQLLDECPVREQPIFWTDAATGLARRGKPDARGASLWELKITRKAGTRDFENEAIRSGWWHQLADYRDGAQAVGEPVVPVRIVGIHPHEPEIRVSLAELDPNELDLIALENAATLQGIATCERNGFWPGHPTAWSRLGIPHWYGVSATAIEMEDETEEEEVAAHG